eukprot:Skav218058  [mRNA]  locus=scaffold214:1655964:1658610:- [translate_table: standard]
MISGWGLQGGQTSSGDPADREGIDELDERALTAAVEMVNQGEQVENMGPEAGTRALLLSALAEATEHDYAATPQELSSTWWDDDEERAQRSCHGVNVILNAPVARITMAGGGRVSIQLQNGHCYEADHCICTLPLGVLKRDHHELFEPALPENKLRSIRQLGVGAMEKVALRFKETSNELR